MAHTTFTNGVTLTEATWFQDVDTVAYTLFGNGTSYTGVLTLAGTTQSTSTTTGQAIISGGMGLAKNLWVGGTGNFAGTLTLSGTAANLQTGANFISYDGTDAGLSFDSSNNATFSVKATATAFVPSGSTVPTNGMYLPAANTLGWAINSAEAMRLDSSKNLGLQVTPSITSFKSFEIGTVGNAIASNGASDLYALAGAYYNSGWKYAVTGSAVSLYNQSGGAHEWRTAASGTAGDAISWTTAMVLTTTGQVQNYASLADYGISLVNADAGAKGIKVHYTNTINDTAHYFAFFDDPGNTRAVCLSNGNWQNINNSYGATSDRKLKQDIELAGSQLSDVLALSKVVSKFRRKAEPNGPLQIGWIAQDVQAISPGLVDECPDLGEDGQPNGEITLAVKYSVAQMKSFKATGELVERTNDHESRMKAIEAKLGIQ